MKLLNFTQFVNENIKTINETGNHPNQQNRFHALCSDCGEGMNAGYCIHGGEEYYCCDECLHKHYTQEEYDNLYSDGLDNDGKFNDENSDTYWSEWNDPEEANYEKQPDGSYVEIGDVNEKKKNSMKKKATDKKCWKGYKKKGTKMKNGKEVNNCVPIK